MIESTEGWKSMVVAGTDEPVGLVQAGGGFLAMTPEIADFARGVHGSDFMAFLGPPLEAMSRVQASYPPRCLRISEIHVAPDHQGRGIGTALLVHVADSARVRGIGQLGLQTLTNNPARKVFEAWGFEVADTLEDSEFEAFAGASGYRLMLREL